MSKLLTRFNIDKRHEKHVVNPLGKHTGGPATGILKLLPLAIVMAGCTASSGINSTDFNDSVVTNTAVVSVQSDGIESTDAELIKAVVVDADTTEALAWQNPDTGNAGTITAIDKFTSSEGQKCKKFQTTIDTFMGISIYNGETCELKKRILGIVLAPAARNLTIGTCYLSLSTGRYTPSLSSFSAVGD